MTLERLLYELHQPELAASAAAQLAASSDLRPEVAASLRELIRTASSADAAIAAIDALLSLGGDGAAPSVGAEDGLEVTHPQMLTDALLLGCRSPYSSVRQHAAEALHSPRALPVLLRLLARDPAWIVRQAALEGIGRSLDGGEDGEDRLGWCWQVIDAAMDDPHWRVRKDLLRLINGWCQEGWLTSSGIMERYADTTGPRVVGMVRYMAFLDALAAGQTGSQELPSAPPPGPPLAVEAAPWWSDDPPLLRSRIAGLTRGAWRQWLMALLPLLSHESAGVRRQIASGLRRYGEEAHWIGLLELLDEPRLPHLVGLATPLLDSLHDDRREALCLRILGWGEGANRTHDPRLSDEIEPGLAPATSLLLGGWHVPVASPAALRWALSQALLSWCESPGDAKGVAERPLTLPLLVRCLLSLSQHQAPEVVLAAIKAMGCVVAAPSHEVASSRAAGLEAEERAALESSGLLERFDARLRELVHRPREDAGQRAWEDVAIAAWQLLCQRSPLADAEALLPEEPSMAWELAYACCLHDADAPLSDHLVLWQRWAVSSAPQLREIAARALVRAVNSDDPSEASLASLLQELQRDPEPSVRAAALTKARAWQICGTPESEPLWSVRKLAARMCKVPFASLIPPAPEDRAPEASDASRVEGTSSCARAAFPVPDAVSPTPHPLARPLGKSGLSVTPLGVSGHYGMPEAGFAQALDAGVNLFFWEPNYNTQTRFFQALPSRYKAELVTVAGTFESEPKAILRDLERALKSQGLEQIKLWLIFWVRDWARLSPDVIALLDECQREGKIHTYGMSTHQRPLAIKAIDAGWEVVMVRHNAAHRGAEAEVLPTAAARRAGLLTFNNLIYGRILEPLADDFTPPTAAECYRYSLSQPGVCASFTAPYDLGQLTHNLTVLDDLSLSDERTLALRRFGDLLYRKNRMFADCVRNR